MHYAEKYIKEKNNKCRYKRELDTENGRNQMEQILLTGTYQIKFSI